MRKSLAVVLLVLVLASCGATDVATGPRASVIASGATPPDTPPGPTAAPTVATPGSVAVACRSTDQSAYVYHPGRLRVLDACLRVSGTVAAVRREADGDLHILLALDAKFRPLLRPANQGVELGDLVIEPVCVGRVTQADAQGTCARDPDPLPGPFPTIGDRVWMEGRYVLDLDHGGWAELHPLYRWGRLGGSAGAGTTTVPATPRPTAHPTAATSGGYYKPPGWDGVSDVNCADFSTHAQAQSFFLGTSGSRSNDPYGLDHDHDGLACESLP